MSLSFAKVKPERKFSCHKITFINVGAMLLQVMGLYRNKYRFSTTIDDFVACIDIYDKTFLRSTNLFLKIIPLFIYDRTPDRSKLITRTRVFTIKLKLQNFSVCWKLFTSTLRIYKFSAYVPEERTIKLPFHT